MSGCLATPTSRFSDTELEASITVSCLKGAKKRRRQVPGMGKVVGKCSETLWTQWHVVERIQPWKSDKIGSKFWLHSPPAV